MNIPCKECPVFPVCKQRIHRCRVTLDGKKFHSFFRLANLVACQRLKDVLNYKLRGPENSRSSYHELREFFGLNELNSLGLDKSNETPM